MSERIVATMWDVAGPDLYRRNAFRITGLPTDADFRAVRDRRRQTARDDPDTRDVAVALGVIVGHPARRLVHELFWLWDHPDATCGCDVEVHRAHDVAVRAHSDAVDAEFGVDRAGAAEGAHVDELWTRAGEAWSREAEQEAFWEHLRRRVAALNDRRLGASAVDTLREELAVVLVRPLIDLISAGGPRQAELSAVARAWPDAETLVFPELETIAEPLRERLRAELRQTTERLAAGGTPHDAAKGLENRALPMLTRLDGLLPTARHASTAGASNDVARVFTMCASRLIGSAGWGALESAGGWLERARALATRPRTIEAIERNSAVLAATVETSHASIAARLGLRVAGRPSVRPAANYSDDDLAKAYRGQRPDMFPTQFHSSGPPSPPSAPGPAEPRPVAPVSSAATRRWRRLELPRGLGRVAAWALAAAGICGLVVWHPGLEEPGPRRVSTTAARIEWNAPVGTCIFSRDDWTTDTRALRSVPCKEKHWGEVLGYVPFDESSAPSAELLSQTAVYKCAFLLAGRGLATGEYRAWAAHTPQEAWNTGENYASCMLYRIDGQDLPTRSLVDPDRSGGPEQTVGLSTMNFDVRVNPPPGSCIATRASFDTNDGRSDFIACTQPHWGEILGYPVIYEPGGAWPGDDAVRAAADAACTALAETRNLGDGWTVFMEWPDEGFWTERPDIRRYAGCIAGRN